MSTEPVVPQFVTLAEGTIASDYALKNLNKSLGEAQVEFLPAAKGEENKWGGYKYTSLENIIKAVRFSLAKHHLTVSQFPVVDLDIKTVTIVTRLVHWDSGEWMQNSLTLPGELALGKDGAAKFNQQTIGGSSTYAQKYAYKTIVGIPDSEELIDSTEDKGDLPSRAKKAIIAGVPTENPRKQIMAVSVMDKDLHAGHIELIDNAKTLSELKVFWENAVADARKAKDTLAEKEFFASKEARKVQIQEGIANCKVCGALYKSAEGHFCGDAA